MSKRKLSKQVQKAHEVEDNKKFLLIVAVATVALMLLMYYIFR